MILLIVGSITSCKSENFEVEPLNVKIIDDTNPAFNFRLQNMLSNITSIMRKIMEKNI